MKVESLNNRLIYEGNTVNGNLPPKIDLFLQDIAQMTGAISYSDISKINPKDSSLISKLRKYSKWASDIDLIPEEHLRKSGVDLDDEDSEDKIIQYLGKLVAEAINGKVESINVYHLDGSSELNDVQIQGSSELCNDVFNNTPVEDKFSIKSKSIINEANKVLEDINNLIEANDPLSDITKNKDIKIFINNIPGMDSVNIVDFRIKYVEPILNKVLAGLGSANWSNDIESDPDYSHYTSTRLIGKSAEEFGEKLLLLAEQNKVVKDTESFPDEGFDESIRFEIPGLDDAQLFYNKSKKGNSELILVVRPIEINKEVIIVA